MILSCHMIIILYCLSDESSDSSDEESLEGRAPTAKRRKLAGESALRSSLASGLYPEYEVTEGPVDSSSPEGKSALDYLRLLWPTAICQMICLETNNYALQHNRLNWAPVSTDEVWTFLAIVVLMGIHRLPTINQYWSQNRFLGVPAIPQQMSRQRFWKLWSNLHLVDNQRADCRGTSGVSRKVKPLLETLSRTFCLHYTPSQEISVDEAMVKFKGRSKGKVYMPRKPVKEGFKIWCCSCSCCGYLCSFRLYEGKREDPVTGKKVVEKGLVLSVVSDLLSPFEHLNHVAYFDNFYTSGPLADKLRERGIFLVGTINRWAAGFPECLKQIKPPKGAYVSKRVDDKTYSVFSDRKVVSFLSNAFPESMNDKVARVQAGGLLGYQDVPPLLPAYNKFMGGVDRAGQLRKTYGFDRKCKRSWVRLFFQFFDYSINNAYLLYKSSCIKHGMNPKDLLAFRLDLVEQLLPAAPSSQRPHGISGRDADLTGVCQLVDVSDIRLARGRCYQCLQKKRPKVAFTSFGCSVCKVRLCPKRCFCEYHN